MAQLADSVELQKQAKVYYASDPVAWINDFGITYDPRNRDPKPKILPFVLFPRQVEFIRFVQALVEERECGLVEKARDMGASWACVAFSVWLWLFHPGSAIGWGSRKESYVDKKGDPKAIFPKIRMQLEYLPAWMLPYDFDLDRDAPYMKIVNPENAANITGEAGANIGRGGRTTIYFKDESAHYEQAESIEAALGDNTDVQVDISSVNGSANVFYRRRMAGHLWTPDAKIEEGVTRVFIFDWREHPGKTQEWYDLRRKKAKAEGLLHMLAQEVDRDYSGSVERVIIPAAWVEAAVDAHIKLGFDDTGEKVGGQDVADEGGDKNALVIRHGVVAKYGKDWGGDAGEAAAIALPHLIDFKAERLGYDAVGVGVGYKVGINNLKKIHSWPEKLKVTPWFGSGAVMDKKKPVIKNDKESKNNEDFFANLKAQGWWRLRTRFYKTHRAVRFGEKYDPSELISLDSKMERLHQLKMELSQAVHEYNEAGKVKVDKKPDGALSPNLADACVICYNSIRKISSLDVVG